jgi:hypothetical protein
MFSEPLTFPILAATYVRLTKRAEWEAMVR